jgi:hypothetical protein
MPVNWAFPAAQGEPESFLRVLGSMRCPQKILLTARVFAVQKFLSAIFKSIPGATC